MRRDLLRRERLRANGGQLDRKRQTIEVTADASDDRDRVGGCPEVGAGGRRTFEKQPHRGNLRQPLWTEIVSGHSEWREGKLDLARNPQPLPARRQDVERGNASQEPLDELGAGVTHVLAVVEEEQRRGRAQVTGDDVEQREMWALRYPESLGKRV
jgi:hypothetical protein